MTNTIITLSAGPMRMEVAPALGACILSLTHDGRSILRPATAAAVMEGGTRLSGCYAMLPFANRIANGRFLFAGRWQQLRANAPEIVGPHALHGLGWQRPWQVLAAGTDFVSLGLTHRPQAEGDWPYAFTARLDYRLSPGGLEVGMRLVNDEKSNALAGMGLHPNFINTPGAMLRFAALSHWRPGGDGLPATVTMPPDPDFRHGRPVAGTALDGDFAGWAGIAHLTGLVPDLLVTLKADRLFGTLRVFTPSDRDFFGVEPVSHGANAINQPGLPPMAILAPGAALSGTISIRAEPVA